MPLTGNRLGQRVKVQYVSDTLSTYVLTTDPDLVITNSGLVLGNVGATKPSRFTPRGVHARAIEDGIVYRKYFVCGTIAATLFATNTPQVVTTDGLAFTTTGRKGERQTFS